MPLAGPARTYRWLRLRLPQPWSLALARLAYLPRLLRRDPNTRIAFAEEELIERIMSADTPLQDVGVGLSERVVEVPWVLRSLPPASTARVLDLGTAFAPIVYKRLLLAQPQTIELADLAPAEIPTLKSHVADIRQLPFADDAFDAATCISTLEHIGMDNAHYRIESGGGGDDDIEALRELGRVGRRVLVTVPSGGDDDLGWLRQYAPSTFRERAARAGLHVERLDVFAHDPLTGWRAVPEDSVGDLRFGQGVYAAAAVICAELRRG